MKKILTSIALLLSAVALPAGGKSARALNPLETMSHVVVEVFVGDSVGSVRKNRMFYREPLREDHFKKALKAQAETGLRSAGIDVSADGDDFLSIGIWGHQEQLPSGEDVNVFLIEVVATDVGFNLELPCEDQQDLSRESKAIGVASSAKLEEVLESEVLRLLDEMLPD